jgi:hypothetical protein
MSSCYGPLSHAAKRECGHSSPALINCYEIHVKCFPCHHDMARPQVADEGDGLQTWSVAVNILTKRSETFDKGWSSSLGAGGGG